MNKDCECMFCITIKTNKNKTNKTEKEKEEMATNWSAYDAAVELYGTNRANMEEIGSRFPLFTRTVCLANSDYMLYLLKAIGDKVTARMVETGLKEMEVETEEKEQKSKDAEPENGKKSTQAKTKKEEPDENTEEDNAEEKAYEDMTTKELYKLCCERGISSQCKKRDKATLISVLKANDTEEPETESEDAEEWEDEEEKKTEKDPYADKTAKELYTMCKKRGIKVEPKKPAADYAKLLKKADAEEAAEDNEEDEDDWEI